MRKSEEIEIINIIAALWKNKYKILIITAVTSLLFFSYQIQKKDLYKISLNIEKNYFGFDNFQNINKQILVLSMTNRLLEESNIKIDLPNSSKIFDSIINPISFLSFNGRMSSVIIIAVPTPIGRAMVIEAKDVRIVP